MGYLQKEKSAFPMIPIRCARLCAFCSTWLSIIFIKYVFYMYIGMYACVFIICVSIYIFYVWFYLVVIKYGVF